MTAQIAIAKMHGARNDFVVLDQRTVHVEGLTAFARRVCDRRTGIGADGVIVIESSKTSDVAMRTINADGTEAEMCGNGVRCAALWLDAAGEGDRVAFETRAGIVRTQIEAREPEYLVRVLIGTPHVAPLALEEWDAWLVDLGNPHAVLLCRNLDEIDLPAVARDLQTHPVFADGVNVHAAVVEGPNRLQVRHWERGVGTTLACGTGAVACAAVAIERNRIASPVEVFVPGGRLVVEWDGTGRASLIGPAVRVFDTEVRADVGPAI